MKFFRWRIFLITSIICLLPLLIGIYLWDKLPDTMAVHFGINGTPDGFAPKGVTVFGIPLLIIAVQFFCCLASDAEIKKHGGKRFESVFKWIIPFITVVLQLLIIAYSLGVNVDMRKCVAIIVGIVFIATGWILPEYDYVKNYKIDREKAKRINRFVGIETLVLGVLFLISAFLPPVSTVVCIFLLIPYSILAAIYSIIIVK